MNNKQVDKEIANILAEMPKFLEENAEVYKRETQHKAHGIGDMPKSDKEKLCKLIISPSFRFHSLEDKERFTYEEQKKYFDTDDLHYFFKMVFSAYDGGGAYNLFLVRIYANMDIRLSLLDGGCNACHVHNQLEARELINKYLKNGK